MPFMLDTNICIYTIKRKPLCVLEKLNSLMPSNVCISSITLAELEYGVTKSSAPEKNRQALNAFLAPMNIVPFDHQAACHYGKIRTDLEKKGIMIGGMDLLIASHVMSLSNTLVTNNIREFKRIPNLHFENWV